MFRRRKYDPDYDPELAKTPEGRRELAWRYQRRSDELQQVIRFLLKS